MGEETNSSSAIGVIIFVIIVFLGFLINLKVIYVIVVKLPKRRLRTANLLVAHLSVISICFAVVSIFNVSDVVHFINFTGPGTCELIGYSKATFFSAFSMNVGAIIYERIRTFREHQGQLLANRIIFLVWIIPLLVSLPSIGMNQSSLPQNINGSYHEDRQKFVGTCISVPLFDSTAATVIYEILRFFLFHVAVTIYLIYALLKIRAKINYLYLISPIPNERMRRKVHSIRYVYLHLITFILIWLPVGFLVLLRRILSRTNNERLAAPKDQDSPLNRAVAFSIFTYFILNPMIYLLLTENSFVWSTVLSCQGVCNTGEQPQSNGDNDEENVLPSQQQCAKPENMNIVENGNIPRESKKEGNVQCHSSRFSTVADVSFVQVVAAVNETERRHVPLIDLSRNGGNTGEESTTRKESPQGQHTCRKFRKEILI